MDRDNVRPVVPVLDGQVRQLQGGARGHLGVGLPDVLALERLPAGIPGGLVLLLVFVLEPAVEEGNLVGGLAVVLGAGIGVLVNWKGEKLLLKTNYQNAQNMRNCDRCKVTP